MGARKTIDGHTELRLSIRFSLKDNHRRYRLIDKESGAYFVKIK
jgi:rRNA maturation protein Nop10